MKSYEQPRVAYIGQTKGIPTMWAFATEQTAATWAAANSHNIVWPVDAIEMGAAMRGVVKPVQYVLEVITLQDEPDPVEPQEKDDWSPQVRRSAESEWPGLRTSRVEAVLDDHAREPSVFKDHY